jgi:hypothetical protein
MSRRWRCSCRRPERLPVAGTPLQAALDRFLAACHAARDADERTEAAFVDIAGRVLDRRRVDLAVAGRWSP